MFDDRSQARRVLADKLDAYAGRDDVIVLALPRGGVPVAFEIARSLGVSLDVYPVRKLGVPGHEELAMGATATAEQQRWERAERDYRDRLPWPELRGRPPSGGHTSKRSAPAACAASIQREGGDRACSP
jgi:hypothetical protein